jgi:Domain of unknown function (DUF4265)
MAPSAASARRRIIGIIAHDNPIGRGSTNYMVHADLSDREDGWREQLWAHQLTSDRFQIACLPFFTYGICHRDIVAIDEQDLVSAVVEKSGHRTLRIALVQRHPQRDELHRMLHGALVRSALAHEWLQGTYLSIDLPPRTDPQPLVALLTSPKEEGALFWEIDF